MSHDESLPFGIDKVVVPGKGTYGFQSVGDTSYTTGFDVYFHPEGMPARAPGYGRMRVVVLDDFSWDLRFVAAHRLDEETVRTAAEPARSWMEDQQTNLMFSLLGAAEPELKERQRRRKDLTRWLSWHEDWLKRDAARPAGDNEPPKTTPEKVEAARKALKDFDAASEPRERILERVLAAVRIYAGGKAVRGTRNMTDLLEEARQEFAQPEVVVPGP